MEDALLHSDFFAWKSAKGADRSTFWKHRVLPHLDQVFALRTAADGISVWDVVQRNEIADMVRAPHMDTVLAHTPTFPFSPHWMSSSRWPAAVAAAQAFAARAPWTASTPQGSRWQACTTSVAHVFTFLLHDAESDPDSAARFVARLLASDRDMDGFVGGFDVALREALEHDTRHSLPALLQGAHAAPFLQAIARHAAGRHDLLHGQVLPLVIACWRHGIPYGDSNTTLSIDGRTVALGNLSQHRRLQALAWADAQGWPLDADMASCAQLARILAQDSPS